MQEAPTTDGTAIPPWTLGWRLQRALAWADVTTEEMADYLGMSRSTISGWLNDHRVPKRGVIRLWALRCGVPMQWLETGDVDITGGDDNPPRRSRRTANGRPDMGNLTKGCMLNVIDLRPHELEAA